MLNLKRIDLGKDEAEQDANLHRYFVKTPAYNACLEGKKYIVLGRKGSGKSAIFTLLNDELSKENLTIQITPDQYAWSTLRSYKEVGISVEHAHTNAWKLTILSAVIWKLNDMNMLKSTSKLVPYYKYFKDNYDPSDKNWFLNIAEKAKQVLEKVKIEGISFDFSSSIGTPLKIVNELKLLLKNEWPNGVKVFVLFDRLDDSWDASDDSRYLLVGLFKAIAELNAHFSGLFSCITFIRSDIYNSLIFDDQDKIREYEQNIIWNTATLKTLICERVRVSLETTEDDSAIWKQLFSEKSYRSKASPEKYLIDRTFKRPRDLISLVRLAIEKAIENNHECIETTDTRLVEEERYSESKYRDLIIENQKQYPYIKDLLDAFSSRLHIISIEDLRQICADTIKRKNIDVTIEQLIRFLFSIGFIGVKRKGRAGVRQRGEEPIFYSYDDSTLNPIAYSEFYIHTALRIYLNITEKRQVKKGA